LELIEKIFDGLAPGSALVLSEKVVFDDPAMDALASRLHDAFKRANGYSEMEIAKKRAALENVLVPETIDAHVCRLERVGFQSVWRWFQALNFVSFIAVKGD
jgi:tRNA (cmo5U34)-methyltransferase